MAVWLVEDGVAQVRPSSELSNVVPFGGGGGTREAGGTVSESGSALLSDGHAPDLARLEGSLIVDEPREC